MDDGRESPRGLVLEFAVDVLILVLVEDGGGERNLDVANFQRFERGFLQNLRKNGRDFVPKSRAKVMLFFEFPTKC